MSNQRRARNKRPRSKDLKPMRLTMRDLQILKALYEYRYLTTEQISRLFFPSKHRAYERLRQLYEHAFIDRIMRGKHMDKMNTALIYVLDSKGVRILQDALEKTIHWSPKYKQVSEFFLEHNTTINNFRIGVTEVCETRDMTLLNWTTETELHANNTRVEIRSHQGKLQRVTLIPDGYFQIAYKNDVWRFFLEVDMGTMSLKRFQSKILAYNAYAEVEQQYNVVNPDFHILTLTPSTQRMKNIKLAIESITTECNFYISTLDDISDTNIFDTPVWYKVGSKKRQTLLD